MMSKVFDIRYININKYGVGLLFIKYETIIK